jgi:hypothetical protein
VAPADYMEVVEALRPSAYVTMADDLPRPTSEKRARLAVERTAGVTEMLEDHPNSLDSSNRLRYYKP